MSENAARTEVKQPKPKLSKKELKELKTQQCLINAANRKGQSKRKAEGTLEGPDVSAIIRYTAYRFLY